MREYLSAFHPQEGAYSEQYLFCLETKGTRHQISQDCVERFLKIYGEQARRKCAAVPKRVHAHLFRHSRAMHLYQHGMDLTLVSQWLGHSQLETTLIYAHADTEHKRQAIAAATTPNDPLGKRLNAERFTVSDEAQLKRLCGLR